MAETLLYQKLEGEHPDPNDPHAWYEFWDNAIPGRYVVTIKRDRAPKSDEQRGYIFGYIIAEIKKEGNETRQDGVDGLLKYLLDPTIPKNQPLTDDFIKAVCYAIAPTFGKDGRKKTLRSMDTAEAAHFTTRIMDMMAGYVYLENPDKNWRNKK